MNHSIHIQLAARVAAAGLLVVLLAAPAVGLAETPSVPASEPNPRGRGTLLMGVGAAAGNAGNFVFGGGLALLDDGAARVELLGRVGITGGQRVRLDGSGGVTGSGSVQRYSFLAELALAARRGRLEPWISGGLATTGTDGKFDYFCNSSESPACIASYLQSGRDTFEGSWSGGATVAGGVRYAFTDSLLVEAELRYSKRGESRFEDVPISVTVGGLSGTLSALWRFELATLPSRPTPGPAPIVVAPPAAAACDRRSRGST